MLSDVQIVHTEVIIQIKYLVSGLPAFKDGEIVQLKETVDQVIVSEEHQTKITNQGKVKIEI